MTKTSCGWRSVKIELKLKSKLLKFKLKSEFSKVKLGLAKINLHGWAAGAIENKAE